MAFKDYFQARYKLPVQIVYIILVVVAMGLSVPRLFMKNQPRTRANTIALGMGAKSFILIGYELLSEHTRFLRKWKSLKAYAIINFLEIIFWAAVMGLIFQANLKSCKGVGCYLSWGVMGVAGVLNQLAVWCFLASWFEFREFKRSRNTEYKEERLDSYQMSNKSTP
ncbi:hypothetical protein CBER1_09682 [Cercospora berteroae]|uniref:MARVEL domain-containing protein n=1 Tax=Cercospora berteroae TaxID=357750 RepID=A0A2S6BWV0_9PEZI|nr:hypothetical protein CBER1_09682 [Cercospora berteroae]